MPPIKRLICLLNIPRLLFHIFIYILYRQKCREDIIRGLDHHKCHCSDFWGFIYLLVFDTWYRNLFYFRIGKLKYFIKFLCPSHPSFFIRTDAIIDNGFLCVHPFATYVNALTVGKNFTIRNNTTIGEGSDGKPSIGDNVVVGVNSVIIGKIDIGNNVIIGAGSIITKSIPDNCTVIGNPARIIKRNGMSVCESL